MKSASNFQAGGVQPFAYAGDLLFVSAQAPGDPEAALSEQIEDVAGRLRSVLAEAGAGPDDVVKVGVFYRGSHLDCEDRILSGLLSMFASDAAPVVTAIPLPHLPLSGALQVELIGIRPGSRRSGARRSFGRMPSGFSRAVRCDDLIFVSGQMSTGEHGQLAHGEDIVAQAKQTVANIASAIREAGSDMQATVKLNTYYVGHGTVADWSMAARVRSDAFVKPGPGATGVPVPGPYPEGYLVRQEAIAMSNPDGSPMHRDTSWPEDVWDWPIPVSFQQGLRLNDLVILGGQVSAQGRGEPVFPGDLAAQSANVMRTINKILDGFGKSASDLAKVTVFYATDGDKQDLATVIEAISPFFASGLPAMTFVPLAKLGMEGLNVEIEGVGSA